MKNLWNKIKTNKIAIFMWKAIDWFPAAFFTYMAVDIYTQIGETIPETVVDGGHVWLTGWIAFMFFAYAGRGLAGDKLQECTEGLVDALQVYNDFLSPYLGKFIELGKAYDAQTLQIEKLERKIKKLQK